MFAVPIGVVVDTTDPDASPFPPGVVTPFFLRLRGGRFDGVGDWISGSFPIVLEAQSDNDSPSSSIDSQYVFSSISFRSGNAKSSWIKEKPRNASDSTLFG